MALTDTSPEFRDLYARKLAELTPSQRVRMGVEMWETAQSLQRAAILQRNPGLDEAEVWFRMAVSRFGPEIAGELRRRR